jgi:hypothetical protein
MSITASARQLHFLDATSWRRWIVITRFVDSNRRSWIVREVKDPNLAMIPPYLLTDPEFARGWLLFESSGEKRRLAPYPDDWMHLSVRQLEDACVRDAARAAPVHIDLLSSSAGRRDSDARLRAGAQRAV